MAGSLLPIAQPATATELPAFGQVTRLNERLPSYWWDNYWGSHPAGSEKTKENDIYGSAGATKAFADPGTGKIFEVVSNTVADICHQPLLAAYDIDTYALLGEHCLTNDPWSTDPRRGSYTLVTSLVYSYSPMVAMDPRDRLLFFAVTSATASTSDWLQSNGQPGAVVAYSEDSLTQKGFWPLPTGTPPIIFGLRWDPNNDSVLVSSDYGSTTGGGSAGAAPHGVGLTELDVRSGGKMDWSWTLPGSACNFRLYPYVTYAVAERATSSPAIYVPCDSAQFGNASPTTVVVKVHLGPKLDATGEPAQQQPEVAVCPCPDGTVDVTAAPYPAAKDLIFDPADERGFLPYQIANAQGTCCSLVLEGYDGKLKPPAFIGVSNADASGYAVDPSSGRVYGAAPEGLVLIDGRRDPLAPGTIVASGGGVTDIRETFPVLPPTRAHPYTRVVLPYRAPSCQYPGAVGCPLEYFSIYADRVPVTVDPPQDQIDQNTHSGQVPAGSMVTVNYHGGGRGYGFHSLFVGSFSGLLYNSSQGESAPVQIPLGQGTRDLLGGAVEQTDLAGPQALGLATSLGDGNGSTAQEYQGCLNGGAVSCGEEPVACQQDEGVLNNSEPTPLPSASPNPCDHIPGSCADVEPTPRPSASPDPCEQYQGLCDRLTPSPNPSASDPPQSPCAWPYPEAVCPRPPDVKSDVRQEPATPIAGASFDEAGAYCGLGSSATPVRGLAGETPADGAVSARAWLQGLGISPANGVSVSLGPSQADAWVDPPTATGVLSQSHASARGVHLDFGATVGRLDIQDVSQSASAQAGGAPGTAGTKRQVSISGVTITTPAGVQQLCVVDDQGQGLCQSNAQLQMVQQQIEHAFSQFVQVSFPQPEEFYLKGSPGGYTAAVEAAQLDQHTDVQFNAMPDTEASMLPAMRLTLYYTPPCGTCFAQQLSRQIIDLAGVEADAEYGINVLPPPPPITGGVFVNYPGTPGSSYYVPGTVPTHGDGFGNPAGTGPSGPTVVGVVERLFRGFSTMVRNPFEALQMLAFLALLGLPVALMSRRRRWLVGSET